MSELQTLLIVVAIVAALPAWLTASILKKHAAKAGESPSDWIPLSVLPFALKRFAHPQKAAIVFGYLASNLLFTAAVVAVLILRFGK
ncbi:MAG TPA: hypothetical protein VF950_01315 [Planctomycetota bacterium]